jgi:hypothetical protein
MASFNKTSQNSNKNSSRFAILRENGFVDDDSEESPMTETPATQENTFEVTFEIGQSLSRSYSDENEFVDLERGITNSIAEFAKTPTAFFDDFDHHTPLIFDNVEEDDEEDDLPDLISIGDEQEHQGGGGLEEDVENDVQAVEEEPLHVYLNIPGFRPDDRSGTLGTISLTLLRLKKSGIHPFPGRTNIKLPTIDQLVSEGYDHKVSETFRSDLALMNSKAIGTMCKWIYDENPKAMENLTVKVNVQTLDMAVEFIFQKKTDKPQATVHGGSTQAGVDEVVAQVVAKHLAENPNAFGGGGGEAPKASSKASVPRDIIRESNTPKVPKDSAPLTESAPKAAKATKATKVGGSSRPTPPRCDSWASAETILADLAAAVPHEEGLVASVTYTLTEGTPEEFASWCMSATGKKSIEITAKKDGKRRVRIFAGDKPGHVKAPIGGGASKAKGGKP